MKKKKIIVTLFFFAGFFSVHTQVTGIVHDPINNIPIVSNWLTAIDTLYSNYDMVMNSVTQIQNQYRQIQQAIENAKGIDWENIKFDGDFDIRNDIKDANKRVNDLLNEADRIRNTLTTTIIKAGNKSYSLADICGAGEDGKDFGSCVEDVFGFMADNFQAAAEAAVNQLTPRQEKAIWEKYGISPKNYYLVAQSSKFVRDKAQECLGKVSDEAVEFEAQMRTSQTNYLFEAIDLSRTSDGNIPEGAAQEMSLYQQYQINESINKVRTSINDMAAAQSQKMIYDLQKEEIEASERLAEERSNQLFNDTANVPYSFMVDRYKERQ